MSAESKTLLALLCEEKITIFPGVYDGYSARLVAAYGFETATISGAGLSESRLGWADRGILTFRDNLNACGEIASCCDLKLVADADTGYGNAVNVHFTASINTPSLTVQWLTPPDNGQFITNYKSRTNSSRS